MIQSPTPLLVWGAVAVLGTLTVLAWRQRPRPGATPFALMLLASTWWVGASAVNLYLADPTASLALLRIEWAGIVFAPVGWFLFAVEYTGRERYVTGRTALALCVLPVAVLAVAMSPALRPFLYDGLDPAAFAGLTVFEERYGPVATVFFAYAYVLIGAGTARILSLAVGRVSYWRQVVMLLLVIVPPSLASAVYVFDVGPATPIDPTPFAQILSGGAGLVALTRFQVLDTVPVSRHTARTSLIDTMRAGAVVVDGRDRVVELNDRAARLLDVDRTSAAGADAAAVVPDYGRVTATSGERATLSLTVDGDERTVEVAVAPRRGDDGPARVFTFRDVTERRRRLERLSVLNRVLRHNLRNEMNVVYGYADRIESDETSADVAADRIKDKAMELVELGDRAREVDEILETDRDPERVGLERTLDWERERVARERPDTTATADPPDDPVDCPAALDTVLRIAVETLLNHADDDPTVRIGATVADGVARIEVRADGATVPEHERTVVAGGAETALDHGNGLGLWLSKWGVEALDGSLSVERDRLLLTVPCEPAGPDGADGTGVDRSDETPGAAAADGGDRVDESGGTTGGEPAGR